MPAHGHFKTTKEASNLPMIVAQFKHQSLPYSRMVEFVIDTGADRTYLSPAWRQILGLKSKDLVKYHTKMITINGPTTVDCLSRCSLSFGIGQANTSLYKIENLRITVASQQSSGATKSGLIPSLLGRDVLDQLSLCYHKQKNYLFITQRHDDFYNSLINNFPNL